VDRFAQREHMKGIAVYEADGNSRVMTATLGDEFKQSPPTAKHSIEKNAGQGEFTIVGEAPVYLYAVPLERGGKTAGALLVIFDTSYINYRVLLTVRDALLTALLETLLISGLALVLVRSTFLDPLKRTAKWLRTLRAGETQIPASLPQGEIFDQLNAEMTHLARDLGAARAAAAEEAQLRETHGGVDGGAFTRQLAKQIKRKTAFRGFQPRAVHAREERPRTGSAGAGERAGDGIRAGTGGE
jgi:trehalose 6-phosphate synthase